MFSSIAATPSASDSTRATSQYSSSVEPQTLTNDRRLSRRSSGSFSATNRWTPMPCRPMALIMPAGVSTIRGGGCPSRSLRNRPLTATPPSDARSTAPAYSTPYPKQPDAAMTGLRSRSAPMLTERSWASSDVKVEVGSIDRTRAASQTTRARVEDGAFEAATARNDCRRHGSRVRRNCSSRPCRSPSPARARRTRARELSRRARPPRASSASARTRRASPAALGGARRAAAVERAGDAAALAAAAVLGRQEQARAERVEELFAEQIRRGAPAVEQRASACRARRAPRPASRTAPGRRRRRSSRPRPAVDGHERLSERPRQAIRSPGRAS